MERQPITDSRSQLLDQIRGGVQLNKVPVRDCDGNDAPKSYEAPIEGMALLLNRALMQRAQAIQSESDDEVDTEEDDDEWDDDAA
ncbi:hypothetical protein SK128_011307 [Halocaridina rubra]|uniref:WH2 domain-containing protein n=1 Tax=Halocaridina rubra TaxID=373956 RepID=A0AAN9A519_HALRR